MGKIFGIVAILIAIAIGLFFWSSQGEKSLQTGTDTALEKARDAKETLEEKGAISSLQDAMGLGEAMSCTYTIEQGGQTYTSEIVLQGQKFRSTTKIGDMTAYAISDGSAQYTWTSSSNQGFKLDEACQDALEELGEGNTAEQKIDKGLQNAEKALDFTKNVDCKQASAPDLTVPTNITFSDQCAMMKDSMKMMEQYKSQMPGSTPQAMPSN